MYNSDNYIQGITDFVSGNSELFAPDTLVAEYAQWISHLTHEYEKNEHREVYIDNIQAAKAYTGERPFLSIVMRTQGKRISMLREVLLCLYAQSNQNFELIIVGHKVNREDSSKVQEVIKEQEETFRDRIRYYEIEYGTRSAPLNYGFSHARGVFIVNCDDDDVVLQEWIEELYKQSQVTPNCLLHVYPVVQASSAHDIDGLLATRADDTLKTRYCCDYPQTVQLHHNMCPFFSIAFPSFLFNKLNIWFDECLDAVEDWDYIARTALLVGVADINKTELVYRLWTNAENSCTLISGNRWDCFEKSIRNKHDTYPLLLKPGSATNIRAFYSNPVNYAKSFNNGEENTAKKAGIVAYTRYIAKTIFKENGIVYHALKMVYKTFFKGKGF